MKGTVVNVSPAKVEVATDDGTQQTLYASPGRAVRGRPKQNAISEMLPYVAMKEEGVDNMDDMAQMNE